MTTESELHLPSAVLFFGGGGPAPASAAAAFSPVAESLAAALADLPNGELRVITVNGTALQVGFWDTPRSEEHTSELQSLMRISYAVFCLKKKNNTKHKT